MSGSAARQERRRIGRENKNSNAREAGVPKWLRQYAARYGVGSEEIVQMHRKRQVGMLDHWADKIDAAREGLLDIADEQERDLAIAQAISILGEMSTSDAYTACQDVADTIRAQVEANRAQQQRLLIERLRATKRDLRYEAGVEA